MTAGVRFNLQGQRFGRLIAVREILLERSYWECLCDCGNLKTVRASRLRSGTTKSCGCFVGVNQAAAARKHGQWEGGKRTPEISAWESAKGRCHSENHALYRHYGERGIIVCDRWRNDFGAFLADMGPRPSSRHSLDRIDVNGNYEPGNCRWADDFTQQRNKRNNHRITFNGRTMCVSEWAEVLGMRAGLLSRRLNLGWSVEKTLTEPVAPRIKRGETGQRARRERRGEGSIKAPAVSALSKDARGYVKKSWPKRGWK